MDRGKSTSIWSNQTKRVNKSQTTKGAKQRDEKVVDWSKLPVDLLGLIVLRLFSLVELIRFRSICSSWRSSVSDANNPFRSRPLIHVKPLIVVLCSIPGHERIIGLHEHTFISRAAFFRVSLSSSPKQGWLIKSDVDINIRKLHLLNCLSRLALKHSCQSLDLLEFTVSEIREVYEVQYYRKKRPTPGFKRVVIVKDAGGDHHRILVIGRDGKIRNWNLSGGKWSRVPDQVAQFTDIIVHKGLTYALDSKGIVWWISSSYSIYRYGPSLDENITCSCCRDMSFVECCGELYIVERLLANNVQERKVAFSSNTNASHDHRYSQVIHDDVGDVRCDLFESDCLKTVGFKVYKMDEELMKWMEVKSLGDYAFVMATDCSFSVLAYEFYGCLQNSVYFIDNEEDEIKVFKLDDGSIKKMSESEQSCFQMFVPSFL